MTLIMREHLSEALHWALESTMDPATAAADWLASDINPNCGGALGLLTDPAVGLEHLDQAKDVYKTMRVVGETAADRRLGATLYLGAIAAALVRYNARISRQSDAALRRALLRLDADRTAPEPMRRLAGAALSALSGASTD